jgi:hypothetical protein
MIGASTATLVNDFAWHSLSGQDGRSMFRLGLSFSVVEASRAEEEPSFESEGGDVGLEVQPSKLGSDGDSKRVVGGCDWT